MKLQGIVERVSPDRLHAWIALDNTGGLGVMSVPNVLDFYPGEKVVITIERDPKARV